MADYRNNRRKKVCLICSGKEVNYKDVETLSKLINERGKILPRRATGACAKDQRIISREIKKARAIALLPFERD